MTIDDVVRDFTAPQVGDAGVFDRMAAAVLDYQRAQCLVYARYCEALERTGPPDTGLPMFLPVEAFKRSPIVSFPIEDADLVFESSRTGRSEPSRHYVRDRSVYQRSIATHFQRLVGAGPFLITSYLPGYADRGSRSSLLYMVEYLMDRFGAEGSGSCLEEPERLLDLAVRSRSTGVPLILFGAAFGLLDLVESRQFLLPAGSLVFETGGMKTHRREVGRETLHHLLAEGLGLPVESIRSEYGMCELLSQCYMHADGLFYPPPWMKLWVVDPDNPFLERPHGVPGALAVLDLANVHSASALLTQDRAVRRGAGFEILGRLSGAELRGCNFLMEHV